MKPSNKHTSEVIDAILIIAATGGLLSAAIAAPNAAIALEKPLNKFFKTMDKRARQREIAKTLYYMKRKNLIAVDDSGNYQHGISITKVGKKRLQQLEYNKLAIKPQKTWDKKWRIILFDISMDKNYERIQFTNKIKSLGLRQLQRSVWITPYPCRDEILLIGSKIGIQRDVTYIETSFIDNQEHLIKQFTRELNYRLT